MASFEKRGKKYRAVISVTRNGKRSKVSKTFAKKKDAEKWATLMEADKYQDVNIIASKMNFQEYFIFWLENFKKDNVRESTYKSYLGIYNVVSKAFGNVKLDNLSHAYLQERIDNLTENTSHGYAIKIIRLVKACLKEAQYDGYIKKDVYSRLKAHGISKKKSANYLSASEYETLRDYLYRHTDNRVNVAILVALETGMRIGEVLALTSNDISVPLQTIRINKSYSSSVHEITAPKTASSNRTIKITAELAKAIAPDGNSKDRLFNYVNATIRKRLKELIDELHLHSITIHGLRHSHASYLIYQGVTINYVSARLGHADTSITQQIYTHMLQEERTREQQKMLDVLSSPQTKIAK